MTLTVADDVSYEELVSSIESYLAEELGVHPQNVDIEYDAESGIVTYTITSDNAESLVTLQDSMNVDFVDDLSNSLGESVIVESFIPPESVVVTIDYTVDASQTDDVDTAVATVEASLDANNYTYESTGKCFFGRMFLSGLCNVFPNA